MKNLYWLFLILIFTSCELKDHASLNDDVDIIDEEVVKMDNSADLPEFTLTSFTEFPEEIEGCSCYFSLTKNAFLDHQFIYAGKMQDSVGYIKKHGDWVRLKQFPVENETDSLYINAENDSLQIRIYGIKDSAAYETTQYKGDIIIDSNGKEIFSGGVYGECGC